MSGLAEKLRKAFRLTPGDPEKVWREEAEKMRDLVGFMKDQRDVFEPEDMWIASECMCAVVAEVFARLRKTDKDWRGLDQETAYRLYIGVAVQILILLYGRKSVPKREAEKHEKQQ